MKALRNMMRNFAVASEFLSFIGGKRWWLVPMLVTLAFLGLLIILAQSSAIAPFIYTLF